MFSMAAGVISLALCLVVLYIVAGYPLLVAARARHGARPVAKAPLRERVSIIIAVRNGEPFLAAKLDSLLNSDYPRELIEIVVVSNASTDGTARIAAGYARHGVRLLELDTAGKSAAINHGVAASTAPILIFTDVRQILDPASISRLVACFSDPQVGVVSGYLVIGSAGIEEDTVGLYWRYERWIRSNLSRLDSIFGATGALYALRREYFRPLPADILLDDMFVPMEAFFRGRRAILEESAKIYDLPTNINQEFRRKLRTLAGNCQILMHYPALLTVRNRLLLDFLSYKFARLLLPWLLVAILALSFFLPQPWPLPAVAVQAAFYLLALLDIAVPAGWALKRLTVACRTMVTLLVAAACAPVVFLIPAQRLWKPAHRATR